MKELFVQDQRGQEMYDDDKLGNGEIMGSLGQELDSADAQQWCVYVASLTFL